MTIHTTPVTSDFDHIPVIDISPLLTADTVAKQAVGRRLRDACVNVGFFYVSGHGLDPDLVPDMFRQSIQFFGQPPAVKHEIDIAGSDAYRGYTGLLTDNHDASGAGDLHEAFDYTMIEPELNVWPEALPAFRMAAERYQACMIVLGRIIMRGFALALDLEETYFDAMVKAPGCAVRLNHCPSQEGPIDERHIGIGAHTDFEAFTMLAQDGVQGLQVRNSAGAWIDATPIAGTFVVNIGDMMMRWTNDLFRSNMHRVVNCSGKERYSIAAFFGPDADTMVQTLPTCQGNSDPAKYAPIRAYDYAQQRLADMYVTPSLSQSA